jgi:predicted helicase
VGCRSGIERQVDVWVTGLVGPHEINIAVECRCYQGRVGIKDVEAFYSFLDDVGANKGVIISDSGFTAGARSRTRGSDVELKTLTLRKAEDFDWKSIWEQEWHEENLPSSGWLSELSGSLQQARIEMNPMQ